MPNREKVIKGLYLCEWTSAGRYDGYEPDYESCLKCPYRTEDFEPDVCCADLMKDALELLKEQEPRVLTLEEARIYEVVWPEDKGEGELHPLIVQNNMNDSKCYKYGIHWRVWSAKPTEEQRKAVKWNG